MASPQLLWLPRLPNEDSPLLLNKFRGNTKGPPPVHPISPLAAAVTGQTASPNLLRSLPLYGTFAPIRGSKSPNRPTTAPINPIWSAESGQNGSFKATFGGSFLPQSPSLPTTAAAAAAPPPPHPSNPNHQLPLPLHHQSSFTFPPTLSPTKQPSTYNQRTNKCSIDSKSNDLAAIGGGSGTTTSGDGAAQQPSARPAHRRRKKSRVTDPDGDLCDLSATTSEDGSHGQMHQARNRKKVRWAGGP
jgi:hypothetical protein